MTGWDYDFVVLCPGALQGKEDNIGGNYNYNPYKMDCPYFINIVRSYLENSIDKSKYIFSIRTIILAI